VLPLARQEEQGQMALDLELETALAALPKDERGTYTGQGLKAKDPHRYALIVRGLAQGMKKAVLAKALDVSWETVRAVERAEIGISIREQKKTFADELADVLELGISGLKTRAKDGKLSALDWGILNDKWMAAVGEATSIVEIKGEDPAVAAYRSFLEGAAHQMGMQAADKSAKAAEAAAGVEIHAETVANGVHPLVSTSQVPDNQQA
jgi:hypothetical protein